MISGKSKLLYFIRHGNAEHNAALEKNILDREEILRLYATQFLDSRLTTEGKAEAQRLRSSISSLSKLEIPNLVVSSPLSRALSTARIAFDCPIHVLEGLRERHGRWPCEKRRTLTELRHDYPNNVDFGTISETDELWQIQRESRSASLNRAKDVLHWLWKRPEQRIACVSHSSFLTLSLFSKKNTVLRCEDKALHAHWTNAELRAIKLYYDESESTFICHLVKRIKHKAPLVTKDQRQKHSQRQLIAAKNMSALYTFSRKEIVTRLAKIHNMTGKL